MDPADLVAGHQASLFAFLFRMSGDRSLAEDLMQETFVRALRAMPAYRPEGKTSTWLYSIAANLYKDHCRRKRSRGHESLEIADNLVIATSDPSPEDQVAAGLEVERLRHALTSLPVEQRTPLVLFFYHEMSYEEIARCLVVPVGTVRSRIHNGKMRLRSLLEERVAR